jgi:hypothetical protein
VCGASNEKLGANLMSEGEKIQWQKVRSGCLSDGCVIPPWQCCVRVHVCMCVRVCVCV